MLKRLRYMKKNISGFVAGVCLLIGCAGFVHAHGGGAVLGDPRSFTGVAVVTCTYDGVGSAADYYLTAQIRDNSPAIPGLLINLHIFKGNKAVSISDTISGDADYSPFVELRGGAGAYFVIVSKTDAGERSFDLEWHCMAGNDTHTDTEIGITQFGVPEGRNF
ncbi:MAG: hypothetical protein LV471_04845 [Nitrosomonas sp.]|nr:hypothetical protein [Nitrosomonas sp.]